MGIPHMRGVFIHGTEYSLINSVIKTRFRLLHCSFLDQFGLDCPYFKYENANNNF